jgi:hypothetical protein
LKIKVFLYSALIGVFSGLAGESKLTGLLCAAIAIIITLFAVYGNHPSDKYNLRLEGTKGKILLISTLTIGFFTLFTFIAVYPFFYHHTLSRIIETYQYRLKVMHTQILNYPADVILPGNRVRILFDRIFSFPVYSPNIYGSDPLLLLVLNLFISAFGVYYGIRSIFNKRDNGPGNGGYLVLIISAVILCTPNLFIPLDWPRYYLFPIYFTCVFFSIGLSQICLYLAKIDSWQSLKFVNKERFNFFREKIQLLINQMFKSSHNK